MKPLRASDHTEIHMTHHSNRATSSGASRSLFQAFLSLFRGRTRGAASLEYITIVGGCALTGIVGFKQFGVALNSNLEKEAKHIQGKGLPDLGNPLKPTLPYVGLPGSPLAPFVPSKPGFPACGPQGCTSPDSCFAAGTLVATESGDRPIESIRVGELVWSKDVEKGELALKPVTRLYVTPRAPVIELELHGADGVSERLTVTPRHRFWTQERGWAEAQTLASALLDSPTSQLSPTGFATLSATALAMNEALTTVYNLEVADQHNYFVGRSHALVHNLNDLTKPCNDPETTTPVTEEPPKWAHAPEYIPKVDEDICADYLKKRNEKIEKYHDCPDGFTPAFRGSEKVCEAMVGTIAGYKDLGSDGTARTPEGYRVVIPPGHDRDHIPQTEASWRSTQDMIGDRIDSAAKNLCKGVDPECVRRGAFRRLGDAKRGGVSQPNGGDAETDDDVGEGEGDNKKKSKKPELSGWMRDLYNQVRQAGTTILVPREFHRDGSTNSRPPTDDRVDRLGVGAQADVQTYLAILRNKLASTPNDKLDDCETAILKNALRNFPHKTNAEYEQELDALIEEQIEKAMEAEGSNPISSAVTDACAECRD